MTLQEVFNTIYIGMVKQQAYAWDTRSPGVCHYRLNLGDGRLLKCAVGMLIPDDRYQPVIEQKIAGHAITICGLHELDQHMATLARLQCMHDEHAKAARPFSEYLNALRDFARTQGLTVPEVQ
jgi:hypothetical protein